ncbi:MFS transporter [Williamsia sp. 1135]|uniref:MFS transporter n=1 Tax=Williamsia sp. 1135 TaxID=1889262 RepID=UPI000A11F67D|nr:MFS transporter [Williamsia sp. 1135]ORM37872.1 hypothetical protein BFL43_02575 [Williamsia sp. 1135]
MGTPGRVLVAATSSMALLVLDSSIVGVMLPSMRHDLSFGTAIANWVVSSYLLTLAVLLPVGGRISDSIGAPRAFMVGAGGFALASLLIGVSQGPIELLVGRAAAGVAAAVMMPATLALIFDAYPEDGRAKAMAVYAGAGQAFATVGPAFGGLCAEFASWRVGFLLNVPIGALAIALMLSATGSSSASGSVSGKPSMLQSHSATVDIYGLLTLTAGLFGISFGLMQLPAWGAGSAAVLVALVLGVVSAGLFVRHLWTRADGLLDLRLFSDRVFGGSTLVLAALGFAMTVTTIYTAVVLQTALDLSPAAAGVALLPLVVPLLIATRWAGTRYNEVGPRALGVGGDGRTGRRQSGDRAGFGNLDALGVVPRVDSLRRRHRVADEPDDHVRPRDRPCIAPWSGFGPHLDVASARRHPRHRRVRDRRIGVLPSRQCTDGERRGILTDGRPDGRRRRGCGIHPGAEIDRLDHVDCRVGQYARPVLRLFTDGSQAWLLCSDSCLNLNRVRRGS